MTTPEVDHVRLTRNYTFRVLAVGTLLGACYGVLAGWWDEGSDGVWALTVLQRAAKTGVATALGAFVTGKVAGRADQNLVLGAIGGFCVAGINDVPLVEAMLFTVLSGVFAGLASRLAAR